MRLRILHSVVVLHTISNFHMYGPYGTLQVTERAEGLQPYAWNESCDDDGREPSHAFPMCEPLVQ